MAAQIKKYANRKLHVEGDAKYLSMLELGDLAAKDSDLHVVCDRTGRDLTLQTLSRALYERLKDYFDEDRFMATGRNKPLPFPVSELTALIARVPARKKA
jgi:hypothetical protein